LSDSRGIAITLNNLGAVAADHGNREQAVAYYTEGLEAFRALGDRRSIGVTLANLGSLATEEGDLRGAAELYAEALRLRHDLDDRPGIATCLEGLALVAGNGGKAEQMGRLLGAADAVREAVGIPPTVADRARGDTLLAAVRRGPDAERLAMALLAGRELPLAQVIADVLDACSDKATWPRGAAARHCKARCRRMPCGASFPTAAS